MRYPSKLSVGPSCYVPQWHPESAAEPRGDFRSNPHPRIPEFASPMPTQGICATGTHGEASPRGATRDRRGACRSQAVRYWEIGVCLRSSERYDSITAGQSGCRMAQWRCITAAPDTVAGSLRSRCARSGAGNEHTGPLYGSANLVCQAGPSTVDRQIWPQLQVWEFASTVSGQDAGVSFWLPFP